MLQQGIASSGSQYWLVEIPSGIKSTIKVPDLFSNPMVIWKCNKLGSAAKTRTPNITTKCMDLRILENYAPERRISHHDLNTQLSYWPTYSGNHLGFGTRIHRIGLSNTNPF